MIYRITFGASLLIFVLSERINLWIKANVSNPPKADRVSSLAPEPHEGLKSVAFVLLNARRFSL